VKPVRETRQASSRTTPSASSQRPRREERAQTAAPKRGADRDVSAFEASLGLTGSRDSSATNEGAVRAFDTPRMRQFVSDLRMRANHLHVDLGAMQLQVGRWKSGLEPSFEVRAVDGRENVRKLAASMGRTYDQDAVMVMSKGRSAAVFRVAIPSDVPPESLNKLLEDRSIPGSSLSLDGRSLTLVATSDEENQKVREFLGALAKRSDTRIKAVRQYRDVELISRDQYDQILGGK
jgi:hypothetical protein